MTGAIAFDTKPFIIRCPNIIIATGGIGALYNHTTNPMGAVGDGISAAQRAGALVKNMELVQFHPTTMTPQDGQSERRFLISEAVRGEGGILRNHLGEAFMVGKHELRDLAPRDIVTREIIKGNAPHRTRQCVPRRVVDGRGFLRSSLPDDIRRVQEVRNKRSARQHTGASGAALPHGRYQHEPRRHDQHWRSLCLRRVRVDGYTRREPSGKQLDARVLGIRPPRGKAHQRQYAHRG